MGARTRAPTSPTMTRSPPGRSPSRTSMRFRTTTRGWQRWSGTRMLRRKRTAFGNHFQPRTHRASGGTGGWIGLDPVRAAEGGHAVGAWSSAPTRPRATLSRCHGRAADWLRSEGWSGEEREDGLSIAAKPLLSLDVRPDGQGLAQLASSPCARCDVSSLSARAPRE